MYMYICISTYMYILPMSLLRIQDGKSALCYAACRGQAAICRLLLENGADIDDIDLKGKYVDEISQFCGARWLASGKCLNLNAQ